MRQKEFILCVDDEKVILDSLKHQLKAHFKSDFIIETAESGKEALEILNEYKENFGMAASLIISDMVMPNMKGSELLEIIHEMYPQTPKILLTGQANEKDIVDTISKVQLYRYFAKPWDKVDFNITVREALLSYVRTKKIERQRDKLLDLNRNLEIKVENRTKELSVKNKMITDSINYAKRIQDGVLTDLEEIRQFLPHFFMYYRPLHIVSGDCYFIAKVGHRIVAAIVDCTGHGVPGALMSMISNFQLNGIINIQKITDPAQILNEFHLGVTKTLNQGQNDLEDGMDVAITVFDQSTRTLTFSGAKRPLIISRDGKLESIKGDNLPIGGLVNFKRSYTNHTIQLSDGMICYMFTDGIVDQFGGENNRRFKINRFRTLLTEHADQSLAEQEKIIDQTIVDWQGDQPQTDDILVFGFKIDP